MKSFFVYYLSDCCAPSDTSARTRISDEVYQRFNGTNVSLELGYIRNATDGGFIAMDILARSRRYPDGPPRVIMLNAAPRHDGLSSQSGDFNGTNFGYAKCGPGGKDIVVGTVAGMMFSFIRHMLEPDLAVKVMTLDTMATIANAGQLLQRPYLTDTQFRSLELLPAATWAVVNSESPKGEILRNFPSLLPDSPFVALRDEFGNLKTSLRAADVKGLRGCERQKLRLTGGGFSQDLFYYPNGLKSFPVGGTLGITRGSSGIPGHEILEIMVKGGSASDRTGYDLGSQFTLKVV